MNQIPYALPPAFSISKTQFQRNKSKAPFQVKQHIFSPKNPLLQRSLIPQNNSIQRIPVLVFEVWNKCFFSPFDKRRKNRRLLENSYRDCSIFVRYLTKRDLKRRQFIFEQFPAMFFAKYLQKPLMLHSLLEKFTKRSVRFFILCETLF